MAQCPCGWHSNRSKHSRWGRQTDQQSNSQRCLRTVQETQGNQHHSSTNHTWTINIIPGKSKHQSHLDNQRQFAAARILSELVPEAISRDIGYWFELDSKGHLGWFRRDSPGSLKTKNGVTEKFWLLHHSKSIKPSFPASNWILRHTLVTGEGLKHLIWPCTQHSSSTRWSVHAHVL